MPRHILPRRLGAHRIACIALYRALLTQCLRVPLPDDLPPQGAVNPIKHFIRKQFRRHANDSSPRLVVPALKAGYAAEELLRTAADGHQVSLSQIHTLLHNLHTEREAARAIRVAPPTKEKPRVWAYPGAPKVLESRPKPKEELTGRRVVGSLTGSGTMPPFLRFKKPQSPYLARVLRDKMAQRARRWERVQEIEELIEGAGVENQWDSLVAEQARSERKPLRGVDGKDWTEDMKQVQAQIKTQFYEEQMRWVETGEMIEDIRLRDMELLETERTQKKEEKWQRYLAKKHGGVQSQGALKP